MFKRLRSFFFTVNYPYPLLEQRETARDLLRFVTSFAGVVFVLLIVPPIIGTAPSTIATLIAFLTIPTILGGITILVQTGRLNGAIAIFLFLLSLLSYSVAFLPTPSISGFIATIIPLVAAGVLTTRRTIILMALITVGIIAFTLINTSATSIPLTLQTRPTTLIFIVVIIFFMTALLILFGESRQRLTRLFSFEIQDLRRTLNAPELADFSLDENGLLQRVMVRLHEEYGFTLAQGALVDSSLISAERLYMALGVAELQRGERFELSAATPLAEALRTGDVLQINQESSDIRRRHLSAGMISAIIVPIVHNEVVLGALDLQSSTVADYTNTQREAFRTYGQRVGQALDRTRILTQLKADVQQQQNIINGQRQRLQELEQGGRSGLAASTWRSYFEQYSRGTLGFNFDTENFNLVSAADLTPTLQEALKTNTLLETREGDHHILSAPIILRGELLGALSFKLPRGANPSDRQREVIQSVVQRLGLALENKRLLQQSQAQANRETKANEVASVLLSSTDVQTVLQLAAQQFTDALGAVNTHIHLQALDTGEKR